jgi:hypothetical protein
MRLPVLVIAAHASFGRSLAGLTFGAEAAVDRVLAEGVGAVAVLVVQRLAEDPQALFQRLR